MKQFDCIPNLFFSCCRRAASTQQLTQGMQAFIQQTMQAAGQNSITPLTWKVWPIRATPQQNPCRQSGMSWKQSKRPGLKS